LKTRKIELKKKNPQVISTTIGFMFLGECQMSFLPLALGLHCYKKSPRKIEIEIEKIKN